jgi:prevent-host-death family protein
MKMSTSWQLQDAKNHFSEVVENALSQGPQEIIRRGKKTVVVLSIDEYRRLRCKKTSLAAFFRTSPLAGIDLQRSNDMSREVDL